MFILWNRKSHSYWVKTVKKLSEQIEKIEAQIVKIDDEYYDKIQSMKDPEAKEKLLYKTDKQKSKKDDKLKQLRTDLSEAQRLEMKYR